MRLRNIPRAEGVLKECSQVIETPEEFRGHWASDVFQNDYPVHIEIGMGIVLIIVGVLLFLGVFNQLSQFGLFVDFGL